MRREAHAHIAAHGRSMEMLDLSAARSLGECLDLLERAANADGSPAGWVLAHGARTEGWREARWPTIMELDRATRGRACVVMSFDHHSACANSMAMHAAELRPGGRVEPGGLVCVDARGEPTGLLLEGAAMKAWHAAPEPDSAARLRHVEASLASLRGLGFARVDDMLAQNWLGPMLGELEQAGRLACDVGLYAPLGVLAGIAQGRAAWESSRVRLRGGKVFVDGTLNSRTASMLNDYRDGVSTFPRGQALLGVGDVVAAIRTVRGVMGANGELAAHAIGDGAVRIVLDAVEACRHDLGGVRVRIEHAEVIDPPDVTRFAELGVVASLQPCHLLADIEALKRYLPHRLDRVLPIRSLIESGLVPGRTLVFGSDVPIVRANPEDSIRAAVYRRRADMPERDAIAPDQSIDAATAWACFSCDVD